MKVTMGKALKTLYEEYEKALALKHVNKPISWALYHTWEEIDKIEEDRNEDGD